MMPTAVNIKPAAADTALVRRIHHDVEGKGRSAPSAAAAVTLEEASLLRPDDGPGRLRFYLSDIPWTFTDVGTRFLGEPIPEVHTVNLDELERAGRLDPLRKGGNT